MATERLLVGCVPALLSPLHILVAGGVLAVYNFHFLLKKSTPELSDQFGWSQHYKFWHFGGIITGLGCVGIGLVRMPQSIIATCVILALLSFAYSIPILPIPGKKRLKDYGWVKIFLLTGVWTIVTAVLPILFYNRKLIDYPFEIGVRFSLLFPLCLAFDIRDMQTDLQSGIYTVPNSIGIKNTYRLINVMILFFVLFSTIQYLRYPSGGRLLAELITAGVMKWVLRFTKRNDATDKIYLGMVDSVMLCYALLICIL